MAELTPTPWHPESNTGGFMSPQQKRRLWNAIQPPLPFAEYAQRLDFYMMALGKHRVITEHYGDVPLPEAQLQALPDNSARFEKVEFRYFGLEAARALVEAKRPVAFVSLHHGALWHRDYGLLKAFPEATAFSYQIFQYGRHFSYPMAGSGALSLVLMRRRLSEGRPVCFYLDGLPYGRNLREMELFGFKVFISEAILQLMLRVEGCHAVPVTAYYRPRASRTERDQVEIHFLEAVDCGSLLQDTSDVEDDDPIRPLADHLLETLQQHHIAQGPAQILATWLEAPANKPVAEWGEEAP